MLESLHLKNVGPAPEMTMDLGPRLNLITGDNGLGKTLLLDALWWGTTQTWPIAGEGKGVVPTAAGAVIELSGRNSAGCLLSRFAYDYAHSRWVRSEADDIGVQEVPRVVVYARADGGISVHDPVRLGEKFAAPFGQDVLHPVGGGSLSPLSRVFQFRERDIWNGLSMASGSGALVCEGLVRDLSRWSVASDDADFKSVASIVEELAGAEPFRLAGRSRRVYVDDARDFPLVEGPGGMFPVAHAPAGLRRVLGLAYVVLWAIRENGVAASLMGRAPSSSVLLLLDEIESHLHPKWQRTIVPSILRALQDRVDLQVVVATHSPMVLASVEATFDADKDAWFDLDLDQKRVVLRKRPFVRHGEVGNWLVSEAFDLKEPRSLEGELAIAAAQAVLDAAAPSAKTIAEADLGLRKAGLPDIDPFWVQWGYFKEQNKGTPKKTTARRTGKFGPKS